ncbi:MULTISPECIES: HD-GYP domain-containing protein [unclassified Iodobacter]|uniref:HD-GYP domain-containing protein n=1 Tax=unclassified Iodobacter TaxID=235634 RepID=UPI0026008FA1|nr:MULTISPECIES: HD domain-containing phosphohydrolase [unclassified Iodobacter]MDW5416724.1 HD domain-containing phosphohydrolase [Iodobacter sp. CM08]
MNYDSLLVPKIHDINTFQDFRESLADLAPRIEQIIAELKRDPGKMMLISDLFRAFHNIKGDAGLCRVEFVIPLVHGIETLLARMRAGEIQLTEVLSEVLLLTLDRLEQAVESLSNNASASSLHLPTLARGLDGLSTLQAEELDPACARLIEAVTGFKHAAVIVMPDRSRNEVERSNEDRSQDLRFFRNMALQLEMRSPLFRGRTARNLQLALNTNKAAGGVVSSTQLEAAVYMHDIGMMFLPESLWLKVGRMTDAERAQLIDHPAWAAGLLSRMDGWHDASTMCLQHHENINGTGYPNKLSGNDIVPGAKIIALVDAFEAVMLKHSHRGQNKSVLRAIAEVNASDLQFDSDWIEPFNRVIRTMMENGGL